MKKVIKGWVGRSMKLKNTYIAKSASDFGIQYYKKGIICTDVRVIAWGRKESAARWISNDWPPKRITITIEIGE